jgi:RNA polymerase sigma-70 factor (ECF subfamily)
MADDITFWADGGGNAIAAQKPLHGCKKVAQFLLAIRRSELMPTIIPQVEKINRQTGIINFVDKKPQSVFSFEIIDERVKSIFAVVNPDKLRLINSKVFSK